MGAWDIKNFGNDEVHDWVEDFLDDPTIEYLSSTIEDVFAFDFLDADAAIDALGAMEVLAAAKGRPALDFPHEDINKEVLGDIAASITPDLISTAKRAVDRIISEKDNELYELWQESNNLQAWIGVQLDLLKRITHYQLRAV